MLLRVSRSASGSDGAKHGGQRDGRLTGDAQDELGRFLRCLVLVLAIEAADELASLAIGEAGQEGLPSFVGGVLEHAREGGGLLVEVVLHDVAHQPDEDEVDRAAESVADRQDPRVIILVEVMEGVEPAAGGKRLARARRVPAVQGRFQHGGERRAGGLAQIVDSPHGEVISGVDVHDAQLGGVKPRIALVQIRDDLEVRDERAQLGRRAQIEPGAGVDIERLIEVVRLHAQDIGAGPALVEREAVDHARRLAAIQEVKTPESERVDGGRVPQGLQGPAHGILDRPVQRALYGQVEPAQIVERGDAEQAREPCADQVRPLPIAPVHGRRGAHLPEAERLPERRVAQGVVDDARPGQEPQIRVGELVQRLLVLGQVMIGATGRQQQAQHALVRLSAGWVGGCDIGGEQPVRLVELHTVPGP